MPNPKAIDVPKLGFSDAQTDVLNIMMNKEEWDYSTVDEIAHMGNIRKVGSIGNLLRIDAQRIVFEAMIYLWKD